MKFDRILVQNYGGFYGNHDFKLDDRGLTLIMGDNQDEPRMNSNGAGKSTLLDALDWSLWGVVPRGDHVDSIVNEEAGKDTKVTVFMRDDDGTAIVITRTRACDKETPKLSLAVGTQDLTTLDTDATQAHIERVLGLDREVFHATVLFGQLDLWNFADATDKQRIDLLTNILQLGQIDEWLEVAKAKRKENQDEISEVETTLTSLSGQVVALSELDYDTQIFEWDSDHKVRIQNVEKDFADLGPVPDYEELREELHYLTAEAPVYKSDIPELESVNAEASRAMATMAVAMDRAKAFTDEVTAMRAKTVGECSACGQPITAEHLAAEVERLTERAQESIQAAQATKTTVGEWEERRAALVEQQNILKEQQRVEQVAHADAVAKMSSELHEAEKVAALHENLTKEMARLKDEVNPHVKEKLRTKAKLVELANSQGTESEKSRVLMDEAKYIDFWINGLGPRGLKSYVLDSRLQEMTDAANAWVKMLTGGTIWVRFETQTKGRSTAKLSNKINIRVYRYNPNGSISERNYKSWSGGEKQRVSLGIDFGLSKLVAARASKRYDLLILDEVFKHLDSSGREAVVDMLQKLSCEKSSILVVDHDSEFAGSFENRVVIRKKDGRSQIMENFDGDREERPKSTPKRRRVPRRTPVQRRKEAPAG